MRSGTFTFGLMVTLAGAALLSASPQDRQPAANRELINEFFGFQGTRQERVDRFMVEDYVQHNPRFLKMDTFTGSKGRQAWVTAGEEAQRRGGLQLVALGGIPLRNPIILMADGDLAHAVYRGTLRDPQDPSKTYEAFAFESFRFRNGRFSEHWDQVRLAAGWLTPPPPAPTPAPGAGRAGGAAAAASVMPAPASGCTAAPAALSSNKQLVVSFFEGPPTRDNTRRHAALLASDYVQHDPRFVAFNERNNTSGSDGFIKAIDSGILDPPAGAPAGGAAAAARTQALLMAECDFVSVVWKQVLPDPDEPARRWEAFTFDTFRIRDGRLAEHWDGATR